jgi:hypothetical protein
MTLAETIYNHSCVGGLPSFWQPNIQSTRLTRWFTGDCAIDYCGQYKGQQGTVAANCHISSTLT